MTQKVMQNILDVLIILIETFLNSKDKTFLFVKNRIFISKGIALWPAHWLGNLVACNFKIDQFDQGKAAVSCSSSAYRLGGVGFGIWLTGKLGRAWHRCMGGAWVHGSLVA